MDDILLGVLALVVILVIFIIFTVSTSCKTGHFESGAQDCSGGATGCCISPPTHWEAGNSCASGLPGYATADGSSSCCCDWGNQWNPATSTCGPPGVQPQPQPQPLPVLPIKYTFMMDSISLLPSSLQNPGNYLVNLSGVPKNLINNDPAFYGTKSGPNGSTIVQLNIGGKLVRSVIVGGISVRLGSAMLNLSGNLMDTNNNPLSNAEKQLWASIIPVFGPESSGASGTLTPL